MKSKGRISAAALLLGTICVGNSAAQTLDQVDRGWYDDSGFHGTTNDNYIAGFAGPEFHNWFVFDMSGITDTITAARLVLDMPAGGYNSLQPTETYTLFDVQTDPLTLIDGTGGLDAFDDLAEGAEHGSVVVSEADELMTVDVLLNQTAIDKLNAADGLVALGGAVTTLSGLSFSEWVFGFSGGDGMTKLVLQTEPAECFLVIGDGPGTSSFYPGLHNWSTLVGRIEDFHLVSLIDYPEFVLPADRHLRQPPTNERRPRLRRLPEPKDPSAGSVDTNPVPHWMRDGEFTVQVVMWNPDQFPGLPEQVTHGLYVRVREDGTLFTFPYGTGTGMTVRAETGVNAKGERVVRFPFTIPGL